MKKVAVILSGCGVYDGTEITEAISTFLALEENGIAFTTYAPDIDQFHVVNHATGEVESTEKRNVLVESNRISRGETRNLEVLSAQEYDALIVVGGFGAAKNLSDFAVSGAEMTVQPLLEAKMKEFHSSEKWILAMCIAPVIVAKLFKGEVTIGDDKTTAEAIESLGATHKDQGVLGFAVDSENRLITTPAFMLAANFSEARRGIYTAVSKLESLI